MLYCVHLETPDYVVIFSFLALIIGIRFILPKYKSESLESYFLAGRKLTLPIFTATLVSTWYGNILGVGEIAFRYGLVNWLSQGIFWYAIYIFFAFVLAPKIRESQLLSIPDQLEKFYGRKSALAGALVNIVMLTPATYILSLGLFFSSIFCIDIKLATIIGALIPLSYTMAGAFRAVVFADVLQFILMFVGVGLILPFAYFKYGGSDFLHAHVPAEHFSLFGVWTWQLILAWVLIAFWTLVDPGFYQKTYAAVDSKTARNGILISMIFWIMFDLMITFTGIYAYAVMPEADPKLSIALFAGQTLPTVFRGIFFAGLIATIMSTLDSLTFSSSMAISYDFFARLLKLDTEKTIKLNKAALIFTIISGLLIALCFTSLFTLVYIRGSLAISALLIPLVSGITGKLKLDPDKVFCSIIAGFSSTLVWFLNQEFQFVPMPLIEPIFIGLLLSGLILFIPIRSGPANHQT